VAADDFIAGLGVWFFEGEFFEVRGEGESGDGSFFGRGGDDGGFVGVSDALVVAEGGGEFFFGFFGEFAAGEEDEEVGQRVIVEIPGKIEFHLPVEAERFEGVIPFRNSIEG